MNLFEEVKGKRILLLDGYCKQCLPFIRSFKRFGCEVTILCNSKLDSGYASRLPDHKILGECNWKNVDRTSQLITNTIKGGIYDIVYPLFDTTVQFLAHHKNELSKYAYICVNDSDVFDAAFDKNNVMKVCMENGIPCPMTLLNVRTKKDVAESGIDYPIIIKPISMYGARGFHVFHSYTELSTYIDDKKIDLRQYVVQELIPEDSKLMGANIYIDRNGIIKSSYLYVCEHVYPEIGGTSTMNGILVRNDILEYCNKLVKIMNLRGEVGIDLMLDSRDNLGKVLEINVRPVHGVSLGFFFGVNNGQQVLEDFLQSEVTQMSINRTDTAVRITQTDVLWFIKSKKRFKKSYKKLGYKHVKEQMFFWDDPLPWLTFLIDGMKNYRRKMLEKTQ